MEKGACKCVLVQQDLRGSYFIFDIVQTTSLFQAAICCA